MTGFKTHIAQKVFQEFPRISQNDFPHNVYEFER